jgi:nickel/cobalt transporter (NiCoT) family protein
VTQTFAIAIAVFMLGLRHGADPDHLAAIDSITRNSLQRQPSVSRFVGTLFAAGHSVMVLAIAALLGLLGTKLVAQHSLIENVGTWVSVIALLAIAAMSLWQLRSGVSTGFTGPKSRLFSPMLRNATTAWLAAPVGFLFGLGFETSSQIATYAVAFRSGAGVTGALVVGVTFCAGMICADTLDSLMIHRMVSYRRAHFLNVTRVWILAVTAFTVLVAAYELAGALGFTLPASELTISAALVGGLLAIFAWIVLTSGSTQPSSVTEPFGAAESSRRSG